MNDARPFTRARRVAAAVAIAGILLGLAACGGDDDDDTSAGTTGTTQAESNGGGGATLDVTEFKFDDVTASAGSTLAVKNESGAAHTITADDGDFDEALPNGETVDVQVPDQPGEYAFHCTIHPSMKATLTVN